MLKNSALLSLLFIMALYSCAQSQSSDIEDLNVAEFKEEIQSDNILLVDVRTEAEYKSGHIEGAKNWNIYNENFLENFNNLSKDTPIYLYCKSGGRSSNAAQKLKAKGFENIHNLEGGITAWNRHNE